MDPSWKLLYQQLDEARNCSDPSRQEQLNILDKTLKVIKRNIIFTTTVKFAASCFGMLLAVPTDVTTPITTNQTLAVHNIFDTRPKVDFILVRRVIFFALIIYTARTLWNSWSELKIQKQFMKNLVELKKA